VDRSGTTKDLFEAMETTSKTRDDELDNKEKRPKRNRSFPDWRRPETKMTKKKENRTRDQGMLKREVSLYR
jgi:hypothetical protein